MKLHLASIYTFRQSTTQVLQILTMEELQGNKQGQQPGRRRRGQDCRHVSDEISTIILDQVLKS